VTVSVFCISERGALSSREKSGVSEHVQDGLFTVSAGSQKSWRERRTYLVTIAPLAVPGADVLVGYSTRSSRGCM
jgi:hypothetical protein